MQILHLFPTRKRRNKLYTNRAYRIYLSASHFQKRHGLKAVGDMKDFVANELRRLKEQKSVLANRKHRNFISFLTLFTFKTVSVHYFHQRVDL